MIKTLTNLFKQDKEKFVVPKGVQDVIPITAIYRVYKDGVSKTQIDNLKEKLYRGTATRADIVRITRRLGDEIANVYGFPIPHRRQAVAQER